MTNEEIARIYRTSKNKASQIQIIAEMEHKSKQQIEQILIKAGETLPGRVGRPKKLPNTTAKKTEEALKKPKTKAAVKKTEAKEEEKTEAVDMEKVKKAVDELLEPIEAIKVKAVSTELPKPVTCNCVKVPSDVEPKLRVMPKGVHTALHNELRRIESELARIDQEVEELITRREEINNYFIENCD